MSSTQSCADFSSVFFLCGRRCQGQLRERSSADISTGQQGCCAKVLPHLHQTAGTAEYLYLVSLADEARVGEAPQGAFAFFVLIYFKERELLHMLKQQHCLLNP